MNVENPNTEPVFREGESCWVKKYLKYFAAISYCRMKLLVLDVITSLNTANASFIKVTVVKKYEAIKSKYL